MKKFLMVIVLLAFGLLVLTVTEKHLFPVKFQEEVLQYSKEFKLEPELVWAVMKAESNFNPSALSKKGAGGLMQLMYTTAKGGAVKLGIARLSPEMVFVPDINIRLGCWYLGQLVREYGSVYPAVVAYNAGGNNVRGWYDGQNLADMSFDEVMRGIRFGETRVFLKKVINNYYRYKKIY